MAESRNLATTLSIAVAVVCAAWAIYVTKHADKLGNAAALASVGPGSVGPGSVGPGSAGPGPAGANPAANGKAGASGPGGQGGAQGGAQAMPVVTAAAHTEALARELRALGTAKANEAVEITSKLSNIVTAVRFADGQRVTRGQVLVQLDNAQARADLLVAQAALTESTSQYNRSRELLATQVVSKSQFDQLEATKNANAARVDAARARLEDTVIRAPFSGRVGLRRVSLGSLVNPGTAITTLDDLGAMKVDFSVPENSLSMLRNGLPVSAVSAAYPGKRFVGKVESIDSRIDATTRSVTVRAVVPNPDGLLKPGMFLTVELTRDQRQALVIPEEALVPEQDKQYVFVVENGKSLRREVQIGQRRPGSVEIVAGIKAGERVVVEGTVKVRDGGAVRDLATDASSTATNAAAAAVN